VRLFADLQAHLQLQFTKDLIPSALVRDAEFARRHLLRIAPSDGVFGFFLRKTKIEYVRDVEI
jgi:hypothetical protein